MKYENNETLKALIDLMDQLEAVGIAIEVEDEGQWHGAEGLSFSQARKAINNSLNK